VTPFTESVVEQAALAWLEGAGWSVKNGAEIAPGEPGAERDDYGQVVLVQRLRDALARLNPALPAEALEDAFRKLTRPEGAELVARNRGVHRLLVDGVTVEYRTAEGGIRGAQARVVDFDRVEANDWLAVNQFSVTENKRSRRPDVVLFVNGLPLAVLELKNAADENATLWTAFQQLQTYKAESGRCSRRTPCSSSPTAWRRARARSLPGASGSSPGAPSPANGWPIPTWPSFRW
jgi:type I restriction enzyme R subunit